MRGNDPQQCSEICCGAAAGEGTGGRAALMTDITSENQRRSPSLSYTLASGLPTAASHAVVSLCRSLKMAPYMAASKPERSSVSLGLVNTGSESCNSMNMIDDGKHMLRNINVHAIKIEIITIDPFIVKNKFIKTALRAVLN